MNILTLLKKNQPEDYNRFQKFIDAHQPVHTRKDYAFCFLFIPFLMVFVFECLGRKSFLGGFLFLFTHPFPYLVNMLIIAATLSVALLFHRQLCVMLVIAFIWLLLAFVNFILLCCRVTPFTRSDLYLLSDVGGVISRYLNVFQMILIILALIAVVVGIVILFVKSPYVKGKMNRIPSLGVMLCLILLSWAAFLIGIHTGLLENQFPELSASYKKNGFVYCFSRSLVDVGVSKPADYSEESIESLSEAMTEEAAPAIPRFEKPNVVIVQLESFFDVNRLKDVTFSENPIPNFTRYMESCPSGYFNVPVIGAGTINSEFEVLTGMNVDDFGAGEYPYKTVLSQQTCETIAYDLMDDGYSTHVIHNHEGDFYDRNKVYANMGIETFTSLEYMLTGDFTAMGWAKDAILTEEITKALDSTEMQDFVFTISVQGHGSYPEDAAATDYEKHVTVSSDTITDEKYLNQISYYVNQLYESDRFVGELIAALNERNENTILVVYGDHLPSLDLTDDSLVRGNIYQTEYFIWNNMGLEYPDQTMEAYSIGSEILKSIGNTNGAFNAFHQTYDAMLRDGEITEEDYLDKLKQLEYDDLYGDKLLYKGEDPYQPTDLQMGTEPITITSISVNPAGNILVKGENFTPYSQVHINDQTCDTMFVDENTLLVADTELAAGDEVTVWQKELSCTDVYKFY